MKINYEKIIVNLKNSLNLLGDNFKNQNIKIKIKNIIYDIEDIIKKQERKQKNKFEEKISINFNSNDPKKTLEILDDLIEREKNEI